MASATAATPPPAPAAGGSDEARLNAFSSTMLLFVNGTKLELNNVEPEMTLLDYLRGLGLTGTKLGCGEGGCGACTVMVSDLGPDGAIRHRAVNACIASLASVDSCAVTTVEGLGTAASPHAVQERMARLHGSQCGFCTPGIVMAMYTFLRNNPKPTCHDIEESLDGNLCRCTGYRPILDAAKSFATDVEACCGGRSGGCCRAAVNDSTAGGAGAGAGAGAGGKASAKGGPGGPPSTQRSMYPTVTDTLGKTRSAFCAKEYPGPAEPIFPPYLQVAHEVKPLRLKGKQCLWYRPTTLAELLTIKRVHPEARLIGGNTEVQIEVKFKRFVVPVRVHVSGVAELTRIAVHEATAAAGAGAGAGATGSEVLAPEADPRGGVEIGGAVTLAQLQAKCDEVCAEKPQATQTLLAMRSMLRWFASNQIRNVALLAANVATASPVSDMNPILVAAGAVLRIINPAGERRLVSMRNFFKSYRKTAAAPSDVIESIFVPFTRRFEYTAAYKQARRREDDLALVGASFNVALAPAADGSGWVVEDFGSGFSAMSPITAQAPSVNAFLKGKVWCASVLDEARALVFKDLPLPPNVPGGMADFRQVAAASFLFKFFVEASLRLNKDLQGTTGLPAPVVLSEAEASAVSATPRAVSVGTQAYNVPASHADAAKDIEGGAAGAGAGAGSGAGSGAGEAPRPATKKGDAVGAPIMHAAGLLQTTGQAMYTDDMPDPAGCLHAAMVTSSKAHARVTAVDSAAAEAAPGVVAYVSSKDVPASGMNSWGIVSPTEEAVFADSEVLHVGQIIGIVVAETRAQAVAASRLVKVTYEELPTVLNIDDAIAKDSFFDIKHEVRNGDVDAALAKSEFTVEGEARVGGQEHFYLETNCAIAVPMEGGTGMTITASTQAATKTQMSVAKCLGLPAMRVVAKVKRMGGGFGGKESRTVPFSCVIAVAAHKLQRPVRILVERDEDMLATGGRHPFVGKYKVGFTKAGKFTALQCQLYSNGGFSPDLSIAVMDRALLHIDNAYDFGVVHAKGAVARTNLASNTAFRGFGGPQGMAVTECIVDHVAATLKISADTVRELNLYTPDALTHYGQKLTVYHLPDMWSKLYASANVAKRRAEVDAYNKSHRYRKRGLNIMPTKYGINFTAKFLNQAGALVHIYIDGSVLITHGGTEMGQGLHTKVLQVAAQALHIPVSYCHIEETATDKVPNTSPTAASASSDLYGMATLNACKQLQERLAPYYAKTPDAKFKDVVRSAYFDRVNLSAQGFYATEKAGFFFEIDDKGNTVPGTPFNYYTVGVAVTEVEVDTLTGDHFTRRADILMDLGDSLNPVIDVGQIEGAYVQGAGWCTIEECVWGDESHPWIPPGALGTRGPGMYKLPSFNDVPVEFNVSLLQNAPNPQAVHSSKAVGEPPFFLAYSTVLAIKDACRSARADAGVTDPHFQLDAPATAERIRMACVDDISAAHLGSKEAAAKYRVAGSF